MQSNGLVMIGFALQTDVVFSGFMVLKPKLWYKRSKSRLLESNPLPLHYMLQKSFFLSQFTIFPLFSSPPFKKTNTVFPIALKSPSLPGKVKAKHLSHVEGVWYQAELEAGVAQLIKHCPPSPGQSLMAYWQCHPCLLVCCDYMYIYCRLIHRMLSRKSTPL